MLLLIDQGDSFTYNLFHCLLDLGADVQVREASDLTPESVAALAPQRVVISSGPGRPMDGLPAVVVLRTLGAELPVLGVGFGLHCLAHAYGARVHRDTEIVRGHAYLAHHQGKGVLAGLPSPIEGVCYHSLVVERASLPVDWEITAQTTTGVIMALRHRILPLEGVQFHPESALTPAGKDLLRNFLL